MTLIDNGGFAFPDCDNLRIGLVCSAGGSVVGAAIEILRAQGFPVTMAMVTDRSCPAESLAHDYGIPHRRIKFVSRTQFSSDSACWLYDLNKMNTCFLFFSRLVSKELYGRGGCFNFHPALLPAFSGMRGLERASTSGAKFFGATVHKVDNTMDGGPILGQIVSPIHNPADLKIMQRISFAHKLYLFLVLVEHLSQRARNAPAFSTMGGGQHLASPGLRSVELETAFASYIIKEGIQWES